MTSRVPKSPPEDPADKIDATLKKYRESDKGKEVQRKYYKSQKGKDTLSRHAQTDNFKLSQRKYYYGPKGQAVVQRRNQKRLISRSIQAFLKDNPGKTILDFFKDRRERAGVCAQVTSQKKDNSTLLLCKEDGSTCKLEAGLDCGNFKKRRKK